MPVQWGREVRVAVAVASFTTLLGAPVGVLWHAVAPRLGIVAVAHGSGAPMKSLIGDDLWLGLLGALAGVVCVLALLIVAPRESRGPGAMIGLAAGGILAMLIAARVGYLLGHPPLKDALRVAFPNVPAKSLAAYLHLFDVSVRAKAVLLTWPFAAVLLNAAIIGLRGPNEPTAAVASAYPGSS
ncbi:MAG TPA: hypothetical protein VG650_10025 [Mycobacteriales bacterium]|nr:hypothetical protein [Mycobacteriales bacterium]